MSEKCDHTIMYVNGYGSGVDFVYQSEVLPFIIRRAADANRYNSVFDTGQSENLKPKHWLDSRRGLSTMFNNCPYCGKKIDWKSIKKELKQTIAV